MCVEFVEIVIYVLREVAFFECYGKKCPECAPIACSGVLGEFECITLYPFGRAEVFSEFVAEVDCDFIKCAFTFDEDVEVFIYYSPFLVVALQDGVEVFEDAHLSFGFVQESVLFVDERDFALGTDGFGLFEFGGVVSAVGSCARAFHYVYAEVFPSCHLHCARVAYCRVEVEVESDSAARVFSLSKCYFNCCHITFCL